MSITSFLVCSLFVNIDTVQGAVQVTPGVGAGVEVSHVGLVDVKSEKIHNPKVHSN